MSWQRGSSTSYSLSFMFGFLLGCLMAWLSIPPNILIDPDEEIFFDKMDFQVQELNAEEFNENKDLESEEANQYKLATEDRVKSMFRRVHEDTDIAKVIKENVRIHCWIMVGKNDSRALLLNQTWVPHCNKFIYITTDLDLPTVDLNVSEGRAKLWGKTKAAFKWIYENELNDFDWFLKADADTFVIIENLRFLLLAYSPEELVYFGCKFRPYTKQGYMSGGSGYVLSREALRRFIEIGLANPKFCRQSPEGNEDLEVGRCMDKIGVLAGDSRDSLGRHRMLPFGPLTHFLPDDIKSLPKWFFKYIYYPYKVGKECCSDYAISFHYVYKGGMLLINSLIYHVRAFGLTDDMDEKLRANYSGKSVFEVAKEIAISISVPFKIMVEESY